MRRYDKNFHFVYAFNPKNGFYIRSGILDENDIDTGIDPFMASFPHLIDVGIMGHCIHGKIGLCVKAGIGCYQSGLTVELPNMTIEDFRVIAEQCKDKSNQFALGGRGDPDQHEHFAEILQICKENNIVPNFTTSGYGLTPELARLCKQYCGAVAVSWYRSEYTIRAIQMLIDAGVKTNIHYVLGKNSIDEAIVRLERHDFPADINAILFLLHKPVGQGSQKNILTYNDSRIIRFFELMDQSNYPFKIGMDSCTVPGTIKNCHNQIMQALDTCEGARFSAYIGADMDMLPCSFDQNKRYKVSLRSHTIENAWNSAIFNSFRSILAQNCPNCSERSNCMGGCPLMPEIVLCNREEIGGKYNEISHRLCN